MYDLIGQQRLYLSLIAQLREILCHYARLTPVYGRGYCSASQHIVPRVLGSALSPPVDGRRLIMRPLPPPEDRR